MDEAKSNPFPFDYKTESACLEYENHLRKLHDLALDDPIRKGFQFELSFVPRPSTCPDARPLAWFAAQAPEIKCNLELYQRLSSRHSSRTQVWVADVRPPAGLGGMVKPVQVVVKFLQPSIMSIPPVEEFGHPRWQLQYTIPEQAAKDEANIYKVLSDIQGKVVPYFYGMHTVITPSGELAWALVLEYVKGATFDRLASDLFPDNKRLLDLENFQRYCGMYKSALEGLLGIHARGVLRGNLGPANNNSVGSSVIITEPSDAAVFVGFALGDFDCSNSMSFQSEMSFLHVLFWWHSKGKGKQLLDWGKENLRKDLWRKKPKGNRL